MGCLKSLFLLFYCFTANAIGLFFMVSVLLFRPDSEMESGFFMLNE